jgi:outer membrane protein assembly factor BamB
MNTHGTRTLTLMLGLAMGAGGSARSARAAGGDDWPSLWGPAGDGQAAPAAKITVGASGRAREVWRRPIGSGFSAISTAGGRGFTGESDGTHDVLVAFDLGSGRESWRAALGPTYRGHDGSKDGPISTPTVAGGRVFMVSAHGVLHAFEAATGRGLWKHDLKGEFGAVDPSYGFATSAVVAADRVIVQAGGPTHNLMAFAPATGERMWSVKHSQTQGYASPVRALLGGIEQVVVNGNDHVYGVDPSDGRLLWSHPTGWAREEATRSPLVFGGERVLVQGYENSKLIAVSAASGKLTAREVWVSPRLRGTYSPTVYHDGHLYGFSAGYVLCVDAVGGEVRWRQKTYSGSLILVDGRLLILGDASGDLRIADARPDAYHERLKVPVFNAGATSATGPTFASGRVLVRNVEEIVALEISGS